MVSKSQYGEREVNACKAVLIELVHLMREIKDQMVIIGGWVADFFETTDREDRDIITRRAYEKISDFLDILGISSWGG